MEVIIYSRDKKNDLILVSKCNQSLNCLTQLFFRFTSSNNDFHDITSCVLDKKKGETDDRARGRLLKFIQIYIELGLERG